MVTDAANDDPARCISLAFRAAAGAVTAIDTVLLSAFENGMLGDDGAEVEDADQIRELLDLDNPAGAIRDAVKVAADRDKAVVADAPLQLEHCVKAMLGQCLQLGLLGRKRHGNNPLGGAMNADIGDGVEPVDELNVKVIEVAKAAADKEVLADIAERSLYCPSFWPDRGGKRGAESDNAAPAPAASGCRRCDPGRPHRSPRSSCG